MKYNYLLAALLVGALGQRAQAQTTAWRPFRPGLVYGFAQAGSPNTVHTLRVDSAYATSGGDSVYTFTRLLRQPASANTYYKSRNNLLGARLRWQPGSSAYYLEANAEAGLGPATAVALLLKPRAAVGSTWVASLVPTLQATLSSRTYGTAAGSISDSVATITLSNGQALRISRRFGLLEGPPWLTLGASAAPANWQQAQVPQAGLGGYDPRTVVALNAGDELGYGINDIPMFSPPCYTGVRLRRIVSRQQTTDSLIITYREQDRITNTSYCGGGVVVSPIRQRRWAFSLRTGVSPQFPYAALLAGEYRPTSATSSFALYVGRGYAASITNLTSCLIDYQTQPFVVMYGATSYSMGVDAAYRSYLLAAGLGLGLLQASEGDFTQLIYYRKGATTCGPASSFATLLPSRAAEAAAAATLHPNPAAEAATLTLAAPTRPGTLLTLTDALGRRVWSHEVAPGQSSLPLTLTGQPAGLYLVQLLAPGAAPLTWKLQH